MSASERARYQGFRSGGRRGKSWGKNQISSYRTLKEQKDLQHQWALEWQDFDKKKYDKKMERREYQEMREEMLKALMKDKEFRKKKIQTKKKKEANMPGPSHYTGIGSRETPDYILELMEELAKKFRKDGLRLRSGHAPGADQAFERGAGPVADIYLPWPTFEEDIEFSGEYDPDVQRIVLPTVISAPTEEAISIAAAYHPAWHQCTSTVRKLHGRNVHQVLGGRPAAAPVKSACVICWTSDGKASGGTGQAIRIAEKADIPVWNLFDEDTYDMAFEWVWGDGESISVT